MAMTNCAARATCGRTCGASPCSLALAWMWRIAESQRTRAELGALDDATLKDIGVARCEIDAVAVENYS